MDNYNSLDRFYDKQVEPHRSLLTGMRDIILSSDTLLSHQLKYGMPFFSYKGKMMCYLWVHKKLGLPYVGFVDGNKFDEPFLLQEKRSRMKILLLDPRKDIPIRRVKALIRKAIDFRNQDKLAKRTVR